MRILLVEDDALIGEGIAKALELEGYLVDWLKDGVAAEQALELESFDAVVLDLGLPRKDGHQVLATMRSNDNNTPVLILTARDGFEEKVQGLDGGADDYVVKPVDIAELSARLRALIRRAHGRAAPKIIYKEICLDPAAKSVTYKNEDVKLSRREFMLLHTFLENHGHVLSRQQLEEKLYSWGEEVESNALEVHIHKLRKKFGSNFIKTIRGVGYIVEKVTEPATA